jgi:hypothetical protein
LFPFFVLSFSVVLFRYSLLSVCFFGGFLHFCFILFPFPFFFF